MIAGGIEGQSQSEAIIPDEAAQGQSYADAIVQGMSADTSGYPVADVAAGYGPLGPQVASDADVGGNGSATLPVTWTDEKGTHHWDFTAAGNDVYTNGVVVWSVSGSKQSGAVLLSQFDDLADGTTVLGGQVDKSSEFAIQPTAGDDPIASVTTTQLYNPADVPLSTSNLPTVAINGASGDQTIGGESFWTGANNYAAQIDPGVVALNGAAGKTSGQPAISSALRTLAAVDEGVHRGVGNFVINTVGGVVNAVTHPVETVVGAFNAVVAASDYVGEALVGDVNPLSDAYDLAKSSYDNAVNGFNQELTTQGSYAAIRDASAGGTEGILNVGSAFVPGLDAADAVRGVDIASDIGRADEVAEAAEVGGARKVTEGGGCFVAGTLVHTRDGLRPIETLKVGDFVLSQPENTGEQAYRRINETFVFEDKSILEVVCQDEHGRSENILATPNHPFWVKGVGWTGAEYLEAGQILELSDGRSGNVISVQDTDKAQQVFNFEVDGFHTYYVGKLGVWVHNTNCGQQGGVYVLRNANGDIVRTGRTNNLARREMEHNRAYNRKYQFETVYETNDYNEQRGLEQLLHERYKPILNAINPIRRLNPKMSTYINAATAYLDRNGL